VSLGFDRVHFLQTSTLHARCQARRGRGAWATVGDTAHAPADGKPRPGPPMGPSFRSGVCCVARLLTFTCT
jgi:hypothetical protein